MGDPDSFGRNLHFLGVAQTGLVSFTTGCLPPDPLFPDDRCVEVNPSPAPTSAQFNDIGRINLPAKASNSLLCHSITSFPVWNAANFSGAPGLMRFQHGASFTIENPVLDDPGLIDPTTGVPFGGKLEAVFGSLTLEMHTMQPGDQEFKHHVDTRFCLGGLIGKAVLIDIYGLTGAQADDFFKKPMTIRLNLALRTQLIDDASVLYGLRLFGD